MSTPTSLMFYTKPGCHLCDDADELLDVLAERYPLAVERIDITQDPDVYRRFWRHIPVIVVGDTTLQAPIDGAALQRAVVRAVRER